MQFYKYFKQSIFGLSLLVPFLISPAIGALNMDSITSSTNEERTKVGLPALRQTAQLISAATAKAEDMCTKNYWAHTSPDGTTGWIFIKNAGYDYKTAGENLARGFVTDQVVVDSWMASPKHRDNILQYKFKDIGIGSFACGTDTIIVAMYGTLQPNAAATTTSPKSDPKVVETSGKIPATTPDSSKIVGIPSLANTKSKNKDNNFLMSVMDEVSALLEENYILKRLLASQQAIKS